MRRNTPRNIWGGGRPDVFHDCLDPVAPYSCGHGGERVHRLLSLVWTKIEHKDQKIILLHKYFKTFENNEKSVFAWALKK